MTEQDFNEMFDRAEMNAQIVYLTEPRAISAHYEIETGKLVVHLRDGAVFMFPHHLGQGLARAIGPRKNPQKLNLRKYFYGESI